MRLSISEIQNRKMVIKSMKPKADSLKKDEPNWQTLAKEEQKQKLLKTGMKERT